MANIKQRMIKAGTEYNYAEGVKCKAAENIYADQIVYASSSSGVHQVVTRADADTQLATGGRLLIAKHDIPSGEHGICLPWKLVKSQDTSSAGAVGDPVYLGDSPGTAKGDNLVLTAPTSGAGRLVRVGTVMVKATVENGGAILVDAAGAESWGAGARVATTDKTLAVGASPFCYHVVLAAAAVDITCPFPMILVNLLYIQGGGTAGSVTVSKDGTTVATSATGGGDTEVEVMATYNDLQKTFAAGNVIGFDRTDGQAADIAIAWFIPA
jgi:hypothetical protein